MRWSPLRCRRPPLSPPSTPEAAPTSPRAMASRVSLSGSFSSDSDAPMASPPRVERPPPSPSPAPPRPQLRSTIVVPEILGTPFGLVVQGGAAAGPSRAPASRPVHGGWKTKQARRPRVAPARAPRLPRRRQDGRQRALTAARPPPTSKLPVELYGCCYNCGSEGHIFRECTNPTLCVRCRGPGHTSRGCTRPRSPSPVEQPPRPPPARRSGVAAVLPVLLPASPRRSPSVLPPPLPGPPPPGAMRLWSQVVQEPPAARPLSGEGAAGPAFSVPFASPEGLVPRAGPGGDELVEACFLEAAEDTRLLEAELARAVLVTVIGTRPVVDVGSAARALHAEFGIGPAEMSIRRFFPEDFLVLCHDGALRERMVRAGHASASWFELSLRPWLRQAEATAASIPFLVPISLRGVPAHAWSQRTAITVLRGLGYVVGVEEETTNRADMADFRVWLRTDRPSQIPRRRILFIDEPRRSLWSEADGRRSAAPRCSIALCYPIDITVLADGVLADGGEAPPPSPPSSPSAGDGSHGPGPAGRGSRGGHDHCAAGTGGGSASTKESMTAVVPPAGTRAHVQTRGEPGSRVVSNNCVPNVSGSPAGPVDQLLGGDWQLGASGSHTRAQDAAEVTVGFPPSVQLARWR
uniref:CCHC-type domain-containing protein n=1 Tax=Aegilops tauschii subsp. strangulata TaxID=200361 RepID=A0A452Z3M5_AEGTS